MKTGLLITPKIIVDKFGRYEELNKKYENLFDKFIEIEARKEGLMIEQQKLKAQKAHLENALQERGLVLEEDEESEETNQEDEQDRSDESEKKESEEGMHE